MRIFLTYVLPLVLPTLVYVAWVGYARKKHVGAGADAVGPCFGAWSPVSC